MTEKTEALRLADRLDLWGDQGDLLEAAAELRRLAAVEAQRDALLEALKEAVEICIWPSTAFSNAFDKARAAIKAVEEGK